MIYPSPVLYPGADAAYPSYDGLPDHVEPADGVTTLEPVATVGISEPA